MIILASTSAVVTFMAIAIFGFVFLLAGAVFGDLFEHGDLGHDVGDHGGPSILSSRVLSGFITAFGGFGALAIHMGYSVEAGSAIGLAGGAAFAGVIYLFIWVLFSQQASSHIVVGDLVGRSAEVSVAIPKGGLGQVRCTMGDNVIEKIARSKDNQEIPANSVVKIEEIVGETLLVRRSE